MVAVDYPRQALLSISDEVRMFRIEVNKFVVEATGCLPHLKSEVLPSTGYVFRVG
jgi:hypothetical protein